MTCPVVRRQALPPDVARGAPVIIVVIGIVAALAALLEPVVLIRGVVDDEIHKYAHSASVRLLQHRLEDVEVAEIGVYVHVVGDVIAVVGVRRGVERGEPYRVCVQALYIIQLAQHAPQVADAVAVPVAEAARPYLVYDHLLVPLLSCHSVFSFPRAHARSHALIIYIVSQHCAYLNRV